jgi:type III secretory pathway component EscU
MVSQHGGFHGTSRRMQAVCAIKLQCSGEKIKRTLCTAINIVLVTLLLLLLLVVVVLVVVLVLVVVVLVVEFSMVH